MANRPEFTRGDRVRKAIIREFSDILMREVKEPRLSGILISVTDVEVSGDLRHAQVFVSIMSDEATQQEAMSLLAEQTPRIRAELGQRIRLRHTPEIEIHLDTSLERGSRITQLLNR